MFTSERHPNGWCRFVLFTLALLCACDTTQLTGPGSSPLLDDVQEDWATVWIPGSQDYIEYRYHLPFDRSDEYTSRTACKTVGRNHSIPEEQYDPVGLNLSGVYSLVEEQISQELGGGVIIVPQQTVWIPPLQQLHLYQRHDVWVGTVYTKRYNKFYPNSLDWYLAEERSFPITYVIRTYIRWFEVCHVQGAGS
jgi:hypothetical protein